MLDNRQPQDVFTPIPTRKLTVEVTERIEEAIRKGIFKPGQKLLSEPLLALKFGISRNTLREALNLLINRGVIYRLRGVGTFVNSHPEMILQTSLDQVVSTSEVIRRQGFKPGQRLFKWWVESMPESIAKKLEVSPGDKALHISRIRTANDIPVISSEEYIPLDLVQINPEFEQASNDQNWSVYTFLIQSGYDINSVITHISAIKADHRLARMLEVDEEIPLLRLDQVHHSNNVRRPVLYCVNYHNDKIIDVVVVRKG